MSRSNRDLLEMVNKLLDVYRYESGSKTLNMQPVNLGEIMSQVVSSLHPIAFSKHLDLSMHLPEHIAPIQGDRLELMRVFNNLIGNASNLPTRAGLQSPSQTLPQKRSWR